MQHKSFELIETKTDADAGTFEATVAVFNNIDSVGDRIVAWAFDKTLAKWRQSGDPIPVILSHSWDNPFHHIGVADPKDAVSTSKGLRIKGRLDVKDNDVARQVHRLMQRRSLREFSFGYSVPPGGQKRAKDGANELLEIDLVEIGPTLKGANPATELHAVKSALGVEELPRSDEEQRRAASTIERELEAEQIPDVPPAELKPDPAPIPAPVLVPDPPSADDLRKATSRVEREAEQERIPDVPVAVKAVGPGTRGHIENLVRYYASKPHPFTECVRDNAKRFGEDRAKRICATLKRMGGRKADSPDEPDWAQELYDAAGGDVEGLLEMFHEYMAANGDKAADVFAEMSAPVSTPEPPSADELRKATSRVEREVEAERLPEVPPLPAHPTAKALAKINPKGMSPEQVAERLEALPLGEDRNLYVRVISDAERDAVKAGYVKAVWTAAYINNLPDSCFLYIETGGSKDSEGKTTPRNLRHFPYKDADGNVDLPHLRNALSRIPQSNLPQDLKDRLAARAQRMLDNTKSVDAPGREGSRETRSVDPLRRRADSLAIEFATDGVPTQPPPRVKQPRPEPALPLDQLKQRMRDEILSHLSGE